MTDAGSDGDGRAREIVDGILDALPGASGDRGDAARGAVALPAAYASGQ